MNNDNNGDFYNILLFIKCFHFSFSLCEENILITVISSIWDWDSTYLNHVCKVKV